MPKARFLLLCGVIAALILAFDLSLPLGVAGGVPYVALVLAGLWAPGTRFTMALAAAGTVLTIFGYFLSPSGGIGWVILTNRGLAVFAIWTTAVLVAHQRRARDVLKKTHDELEERVQRRTIDLEASEARFMDFAESSSDWFWELDRELRFSYISERYYEITGFQPEDKIGQTRTDGVNAADLEAEAEKWAAHQADMEAHRPFRNFEYALEVPRGGAGHFRISGKPVFDAGGRFLGYRGTGSDITGRIQADAALRQNETRYRELTEGSLQGVGIVQDDLIAFTNGVFAQLLGYRPEEMVGRPVADFIMPEYRDLVAERREARLRGEEQPAKYDLVVRHRDGHGIWVALLLRIIDWKGRAAVQISIIDISQRKEAEAALLAAKDEAEHANRAKSEFLAHFSHELRTPLNAIMGFSDIMRQEMLGPLGQERYREYAGDIHQSGGHLLALISDILDLSRIEAGQLELDERVFDAGVAAEECARLLRGRAGEKGVAIDLRLPEAGLWLEADERQFRQILLNLLSNAVKFTRKNTTITFQAEIVDNGAMCFHIGDRGEGMSAEDIERVQEPFIRLQGAQTSSEEGTGLGLAITKRLAESHGGRLRLSSEVGVGTTATVSFPRERVIGDDPRSFSAIT